MDTRRVIGAPGRRGATLAAAVPALGLVAASAGTAFALVGAVMASLLLAAIALPAYGSRDRAVHLARLAEDRRRAETGRADRAEAALRERTAELTGFSAAAGQDLLIPLHTIASFTALLVEDSAPQLDAASRGFLDRIARSTGRMLGTVDELVAYTATTDVPVDLEPVDTQHLALDVAASLIVTGERPGIDIGDLPMVSADPVLLRQVLDHLIGNAARFVRHGTAARITVGAQELPDGWWRIEVADRGIGVPADQRSQIFAPFHRTPAAAGFPGAGLGLAICRRIVASHGGEIGVRANPGGGSVFWFTVSATGVTLSADDLAQLAAA